MNVVTIPKSDYLKLQREQKYLRSEICELKKIMQRAASEELSQTTIKRLLGRSQRMDKGDGIKFHYVADVKKYLRQM